MSQPEWIYDWNVSGDLQAVFPKAVELCDETLRDGLQSPSVRNPPLETKFKMVQYMADLGITIANIGLPGAGERATNDVREIARYVRDNRLKLQVDCAARTIISDIEPIARIQEEIGIPIVAYCFLGTSPIRQYVEDWDINLLLHHADEAISFAMKNQLEVAFVTEDTIRSDPDTLECLFREAISLGCRRLVLCDTVGHATPEGVINLVKWTQNLCVSTGQDVKLDWHGHNDRGLSLINSLYAAQAGCDRIHGTCLGIGERVGNTSIDQLIVNLKLLGQYHGDASSLVDYVKLTSEACDVPIPKNYPLSGCDAFRTATGVHAAAVIKAQKKGDALIADLIYSGVPANWFGCRQTIEIGPMSGLSNVRHWLESRGISASDEIAQQIFNKAKHSDRVLSDQEVYDAIQVNLS
jgi:2-isopropylmalate synthase